MHSWHPATQRAPLGRHRGTTKRRGAAVRRLEHRPARQRLYPHRHARDGRCRRRERGVQHHPGTLMRCPRCRLGDLNEKTHTCVLCGYSVAQPADTVTVVPAAPAAPAAPQTELDARRELAHEFRIERLLEHATTPIAYVARDAEDRALTLKAVPLGQLGAPVDRILAAVDAAARLDHPHIVPIHDSGMTQHFFWYASRHVEGRTLKSILEAVGSIELPVCLRIFEQVASALDYAHRRGVAHEALSLECIIVDANEWVLVGDFGTAGLLAPPPTGS